ncbi:MULTISPECIES: hypothetical protein [Psychrobacter]|jgi:hypothetical protein|uniref:TerB N-terminal domain-containing protein n=1 Tax=Psychrobacter glaciei TaxID=619771 RepID=A0ABQ3GVW3_9GAMM|nr:MULTISPECIES: hypothetical protein [Psychrobacter]PKH82353.1 hypothetical protein CXF60_01690 [Psychrobacter sp. 4Bb]GHD38481.1 hypothetical protein GCM10016272_27680 [Psychrobacter glaciei]|tara:strand:+ start:880 stop:2103 length:1224 start_codon:yes stop_codon:yes gene_type:complete
MIYANNSNYNDGNSAHNYDRLNDNYEIPVEKSGCASMALTATSDNNGAVVEGDNQPSTSLNQEVLNQANAYHQAQQYKFSTDLYFYHAKQNWKNHEDFYKTIGSFNEEDCKSLVFAHNVYLGNLSANIEFDKGAFKSTLISIFKSQPYPIPYFHELMRFKINNQLPDSSLNWIKGDLRSALHIAYLVQGFFYNKTMVGGTELISHISNYLKYEIMHFNYTPLTLPYYANYVVENNLPLIWRIETIKSVYFRNRTDREIKWLKGDDSDQIEWAYNYLSSDKRDHLILQDIFIPSSIEDKYNLILASLDVLSNAKYTYEAVTKNIDISDPTVDLESIAEISYRAKIIENMKDAWAKFSTSNKNEDLSEVKIYKKNQDQLDSIIKAKGTTANKVISQIIEDEYKKIFNKG